MVKNLDKMDKNHEMMENNLETMEKKFGNNGEHLETMEKSYSKKILSTKLPNDPVNCVSFLFEGTLMCSNTFQYLALPIRS